MLKKNAIEKRKKISELIILLMNKNIARSGK
jgi:hypothetical protein